uniref:Uncharacterized protein n=1 Tax=Caulobacter phage S2L TaxID=3348356 RepID=A0AB74ULE3_9VIRU
MPGSLAKARTDFARTGQSLSADPGDRSNKSSHETLVS